MESLDIPTPDENQQLPNHIMFGIHDGVDQSIDEYVLDAQVRLEEKRAVEEVEVDAFEKVSEALQDLPMTSGLDAMLIERYQRRQQIISGQQRRRQFGRPILSLAVLYPPRDH